MSNKEIAFFSSLAVNDGATMRKVVEGGVKTPVSATKRTPFGHSASENINGSSTLPSTEEHLAAVLKRIAELEHEVAQLNKKTQNAEKTMEETKNELTDVTKRLTEVENRLNEGSADADDEDEMPQHPSKRKRSGRKPVATYILAREKSHLTEDEKLARKALQVRQSIVWEVCTSTHHFCIQCRQL